MSINRMRMGDDESILTSDGTLNVDLLSKEIAHDLAKDERYKAEDSMKKRAVHTSKDYDEFRAFVSCSQLKPVQGSKEMSELIQPLGVNKRNSGSRKVLNGLSNSEDYNNNVTISSRSSSVFPKVPASNYMEFQRDWSRHCNTDHYRIKYLSMFSPENTVSTIFNIEMPANILSDICGVFYRLTIDDGIESNFQLEEGKNRFIMSWMNAIPRCGRFDLNVAFLENGEKEKIRSICTWLCSTDESISQQKINDILHTFNT